MRRLMSVLISICVLLFGTLFYQSSHSSSEFQGPDSSASASTSVEPNGTPAELANYYEQQVSWEQCGAMECTTILVPIDYRNPGNGSLSLAVNRLVGPKSDGRALFVNPGGPGGSGLQYAEAAEYIASKKLLKNFDLVGFDPRGVGSSTPVKCLDDQQTDEYIALDGSPDNQKEIDDDVAFLKTFADACANSETSDLYGFVDTVSAARDIDILRAVLQQDKLNWFGKSYGTFLGATYAELFPERVGRMMLDGAIDPSLSNEDLNYDQAAGFEDAINRFAAFCLQKDSCPLSGSTTQAVGQIKKYLDDVDATPIPLKAGRKFTQAIALTGIIGPLYSKSEWETLINDLSLALDGDPSHLVANTDYYTSRTEDGTFSDNSNDAIVAVNCLDRPDSSTVAETQKLADKWGAEMPIMGSYMAWGNIGCAYWKAKPTGKPHKISAQGSAKILVVGTTHDPATPYKWAKGLASQLSNATLLSMDGDGHTAYFEGSDCIDKYVDNYFLTGEAPNNVMCTDAP